MSGRKVARKRRAALRWGAGITALALAVATLVTSTSGQSDAIQASGGVGRFGASVHWITWGGDGDAIPAAGASATDSFTAGGQTIETTCTISSIAGGLTAYRPGNWTGDGLDELYNIGGAGSSNTLVNGLRISTDGTTVTFDFSCTGSVNGQTFPLAGLVFADAEQSGTTDEFIAATAPTGATWRVIDRYRDASCTQSTQATVSAANRLTLLGDSGTMCAAGPTIVSFLDGATSATDVTLKGHGLTAIALGFMLSADYGDAPASYGDPVHLVQSTWSGGSSILTTPTAVSNPGFTLATQNGPSLRLGATVDAEDSAASTADASGDDATTTDDEDGLATAPSRVYAVPGETYSLSSIACTDISGIGKIAGWIDWNGNGQFDSGERSALANCVSGTTSLSWTIPADTATSASFLRLRIGADAASVATATDIAVAGEVEDYPIAVELAQPVAAPDSITTQQNVTSAPIQPADNDSPNPVTSSALTPTSIRLMNGSTPVTSLSVTGGQYVVDTATGTVTFVPSAGFQGVAPAATYRITDANGISTTSTITATVSPVAPVAQPDAVSTTQSVAVVIDVPANDQPGNAQTPIDPTTVLLTPGTSGGTVSNGGRTLIVTGVGRFDVSTTTGQVTFTPLPSFVGSRQIGYTIADVDGSTASTTVTVTVSAQAPIAQPDSTTTPQNTPVTTTPSANDQPGVTGGTAINPSSTRLINPSTGATTTSPVSVTGGTYSLAPSTGVVTFTPTPGFTGVADSIEYEVADALGETGRSTITVTVTPVSPTAVDDSGNTPQGAAVTVDVAANDQPGNAATPLDRSSTRLVDPGNGATLFAGGLTLLVPGEGTYTLVGAPSGAITFTPISSFAGAATPVQYTIADVDGTTTTAVLSITVEAVPPRANIDAATTPQNTAVSVPVIDNDETGIPGGSALDSSSVVLLDGTTPVTTLAVADGVFTVDSGTGDIVFTPAQGFTGAVPAVTYRVSDANGESATSTVSITVTAVAPTAAPDQPLTQQGVPVVFPPLSNDAGGNAGTPLDPTTVLLATNGIPGAVLSPDSRQLTIPGEGTYLVDAVTGEVTFTPVPAFSGLASPIGYSVADVDGTIATSSIQPSVAPTDLVAVDDLATGTLGAPVTIDPLANDLAGTGAPLDPTTVQLVDPGLPGSTLSPDGKTLTVANVGEWVVDPVTGVITFTAVDSLRADPPVIGYTVADTNGVLIGASVHIQLTFPALASTGVTPERALGLALSLLFFGLGGVGVRSAWRMRRLIAR